MREPWMMLDAWGDPIPVEVFAEFEQRVIAPDEFRRIAESSGRLAPLLAQRQDGDTVLWYTSPDAEWAANMGSEGYALCRNGFLVDDVVMKMN